MLTGTLDRNRRERVQTDSGRLTVHRNHILTSPLGALPSPQAYLVEQGPREVLRSHFHFNSQFQVFVTGAGTIGRHEARPYLVQYASRQTGYGPITAGPTGLEYLTLRPTTIKDRAQYLPESRDLAERDVPKRQVVSALVDVCRGDTASTLSAIIEPTTDGLGAWYVHLPAKGSCRAPELQNGSGRFYVVVGGSLALPHGALEALSVVWTDKDEPPLELRADAEPLDVLVLQLPDNAWSL